MSVDHRLDLHPEVAPSISDRPADSSRPHGLPDRKHVRLHRRTARAADGPTQEQGRAAGYRTRQQLGPVFLTWVAVAAIVQMSGHRTGPATEDGPTSTDRPDPAMAGARTCRETVGDLRRVTSETFWAWISHCGPEHAPAAELVTVRELETGTGRVLVTESEIDRRLEMAID